MQGDGPQEGGHADPEAGRPDELPNDRIDGDRPVYGISVAAELSGLGVQSLRLYETRGLIEPSRTEGGTRRYSNDDISRLGEISSLVDEGLNLAGIARVLELQDEVHRLNDELTDARADEQTPGEDPSAHGSVTDSSS